MGPSQWPICNASPDHLRFHVSKWPWLGIILLSKSSNTLIFTILPRGNLWVVGLWIQNFIFITYKLSRDKMVTKLWKLIWHWTYSILFLENCVEINNYNDCVTKFHNLLANLSVWTYLVLVSTYSFYVPRFKILLFLYFFTFFKFLKVQIYFNTFSTKNISKKLNKLFPNKIDTFYPYRLTTLR